MKLRVLLIVAALCAAAAAECVPFEQLQSKKGDAVCITGKVVKVNQSQAGNWFLDFCENYRQCPFSVFIFEKDAAKLGDLRGLQGQQVTIYGRIREYNGKPELILRDRRQLEGEKVKYLPEEDEPKGVAMNRDFDASKHGPKHHHCCEEHAHNSHKKPKAGESTSAAGPGTPGAIAPSGGSTTDPGTTPAKPKN
jgi:hypothetical protein